MEHTAEAFFFFKLFSNERENLLAKKKHTRKHTHGRRSMAECFGAGREVCVEERKHVLNHISSIFLSFFFLLFSVVLIQKLQFLAAASSLLADPQLSFFLLPD